MIQKGEQIKVLVVDDSAIVRKILSEGLSTDTEIEVVGTAPDPYIARDKILKFEPDLVILDIEMPKMDGLTFLKKIMKYHPMPVIIVSSLTKNGSEKAIEALFLGAIGVMAKPGGPFSVGEMKMQLIEKVKTIRQLTVKKQIEKNIMQSKIKSLKINKSKSNKKLIAIGASTGGTEAIKEVLYRLPNNIPGIVITLHMPPHFTKSYAERLNEESNLNIKEAENGDQINENTVLIAPGGYHMIVKKVQDNYIVKIKEGPLVHHQKPSVDVLFNSVASEAGKEAIGVILTGMGKDGAAGLLKMKQEGSFNIAQDENSCVVFGMPKQAISNSSVNLVLPVDKIADEMIKLLTDVYQEIVP